MVAATKLFKLKKELKKLSNHKQAKNLQRFFKTGKGEYGERDIFLGIKVPVQRKIATKYLNINLRELQILLNSRIHEHRFIALIILLDKYKRPDKYNTKRIVDFYLKNTKNINNWDLVDYSAGNILGNYLLNKNKMILYKLVRSKNLWERRIAIVSTLEFIKNNKFNNTLRISKILINDKHDLIHKAVGWMLREVGKKNQVIEERFLKRYYKNMPRTMLRYAIERFDKNKRQKYLRGEI